MYDAGPDGNTGTCNSEDKIGDKQDCDLYSF